jgi:hypothetical protein
MYITILPFINALKKTMAMAFICIGSFLVYTLLLAIFNHTCIEPLLMLNPFISGFLHNGVSHFLINLLLFAGSMACTINSAYSIRYLYWLTVFISLLYLPISILGLTLPAIGISGLCYYLMVRALLTWNTRFNIGRIIFWILAISEVYGLMVLKDDVAHGVHLIGIGLGVYSLKNTKMLKLQ